MDGIHDLGGKQGYGPIDVGEPETSFHHDWEGREWGIAQSARTPGITIDWWRHCRELIMPEDYLQRPYFDSWAQTDISTYVEAGWIKLEDINAGKLTTSQDENDDPPEALTLQQVLQADHDNARRFDAEINQAPAFVDGQQVITAAHGHAGHSRLPQYARGRRGIIHAHHGAHLFPDLGAQGKEIHQHCYSVMFTAGELWSATEGSHDKVYLDLWESYLTGV